MSPLWQFPRKATNSNEIFKNAEFWLEKGRLIQQGNRHGSETDFVALDYYLSGVKIDPSHFGCIYNVGCCHFNTGKYTNARKWLGFAIKADPSSLDSYFGLATACLKLGLYKEALHTAQKIDREDWSGHHEEKSLLCNGSQNFTWLQVVYLHALCLRINGWYQEANENFKRLSELQYVETCNRLKNITCSLIILPLMKYREQMEDILENWVELVNLYDQGDHFDPTIVHNLQTIENQRQKHDGTRGEDVYRQYLARYLHTLPFFKRMQCDRLERFIKEGLLEVTSQAHGELLPTSYADEDPSAPVHVIINGKVLLMQQAMASP